MIIELLSMNGYGIFVWAAFIFTFFCCLSLYYFTKKEMKRLEKDFVNKLEKLSSEQIKVVKEKKVIKGLLAEYPNLN